MRKSAQEEMNGAEKFKGELGGMAKGLGEMKDEMDQMMQQKKDGKADPEALRGLIDSLSQMADMPHEDMHIVGTGDQKMYDLRFLGKKAPEEKKDKNGKHDVAAAANDAVAELATCEQFRSDVRRFDESVSFARREFYGGVERFGCGLREVVCSH